MSKPKSKKYVELKRAGVCNFCKNNFIKSIHNQIYCKTCCPNASFRRKIDLYNLSYPQYIELLNLNNGMCEICKIEKATDIDHCHKTGKVRGMLCHNCNMMLGHAKDNKESLIVAIEYLNR